MQQLVLVRGLPGSGKSTYAKKHFPKYKHFEADQYFVNPKTGKYSFSRSELNLAHEQCQQNTLAAIEDGFNVVISNTFLAEWEFDFYFNICYQSGCALLVIEMRTQFDNIHGADRETLDRMKSRFQEWGTFEVPVFTEYQIVQ